MLSFLFVYMCLSVWLLQIYLFAIFFFISGSSRFGYLSVDLSIDLLIYLSIVLSISLLTYLRTWFINMYIYKYYIYIYYLYHLVIISRYSYCKLSASHLFLYPASIYFSFYLFVHTYPCFFSLCMSLSCDCLSVAFSKDLGPGKYMYDPRT